MKKLLLIVVAALFACNAFGQAGIIAGISSSKSQFSDWKEVQSEINNATLYHVGLTYKFEVLDDFFVIQPSLIYNVKGAKVGDVKKVNDLGISFKTGYLELPVQLQVGFSLLSLIRIYGIVEPFVGYAITNESVLKLPAVDQIVSKDWSNIVNRLEYGVGFGLGVELIQHVQISARYFWNLGEVYGIDKNILKTSTEYLKGNKCNGIMVSAAFVF